MAGVEEQIRRTRAIAIFRGDFPWSEVAEAMELLLDHGINVIEYTLTSPRALDTLTRLKARFGSDATVGAGTVVSPFDAAAAKEAGADFLVSPHWDQALSDAAHAADSLLLPGVFTPAEVATARQNGWNLLKLFPASIGGPQHIRALHGPYPDVDFVPTGGVDETNAADFLCAGAVAIGIGSSAINPGATTINLRSHLNKFRAVLDEAGRG